MRVSSVLALQVAIAFTLNGTGQLGGRWRLKHLTVGLDSAQTIHDLLEHRG